jgi:hypothetical protein
MQPSRMIWNNEPLFLNVLAYAQKSAINKIRRLFRGGGGRAVISSSFLQVIWIGL